MYERLKQTFLVPDSSLYKKRESLRFSTTTHLDRVKSEAALKQKIKRCKYVAEIIGAEGKKIIDFGSGLGFLSCYLASAGAKEVTGIEIMDDYRDASYFLANNTFKIQNVNFLKTKDDLQPNSYDVIILDNVISHLNKPIEYLADLKKLLVMNGMLFIIDNNNFQSFLIRKRNKKMWDKAESQYRLKRRKMISELDHLSQMEVDTYTDLTYGLDIDAAKWWIGYGNFEYLRKLKNFAPFDPEIGLYHENSFTPKELNTILFNLGFIPILYQPKYVFDFKENRLVSFIFEKFKRLSLYFSPAYEVMAVKYTDK